MVSLAFVLLVICITKTSGPPITAVFTPGMGGFPCIRTPALVTTTSAVLFAAAECRNYTGDHCFPTRGATLATTGSTTICYRRSVDAGVTWSKLMLLPPITIEMNDGGGSGGGGIGGGRPATAFSMYNMRLVAPLDGSIIVREETRYTA